MNYSFELTFIGLIFIAGLDKIMAEELCEKIVGGTPANHPGEFPWIVSIKLVTGRHVCGGVIYNENYIVTAAHCGCFIQMPWLFKVVAGEYKLSVNDGTEQKRWVATILCHPDFNPMYSYQNDIAIWKLRSPFNFTTASVKAAQLAQAGFIPANDTVTVAGWGYTSGGGSVSDTLLKVNVPMVGYSKCTDSYGSDINGYSNLCAGADNKGACVGDSGGPLHSGSTVCGIVSYGNDKCTSLDYPGVFSNVAYFYDWIYDHTNFGVVFA